MAGFKLLNFLGGPRMEPARLSFQVGHIARRVLEAIQYFFVDGPRE